MSQIFKTWQSLSQQDPKFGLMITILGYIHLPISQIWDKNYHVWDINFIVWDIDPNPDSKAFTF